MKSAGCHRGTRAAAVALCVLAQITGAHLFIIPDEVPSILSVIYSNIPTLKKGTDSRLGWGFRLGDRADFQVLVELGPQQYTQPLGNQGDGGNSKRDAAGGLADTLYAQRQEEKRRKQEEEEEERRRQAEKQVQETEGSKWLRQWSSGATEPPIRTLPPGAAPGEIDAKSVIPDDAFVQLLRLYRRLKKEQEARRERATLTTEGARNGDVTIDAEVSSSTAPSVEG